MKNVLGIISTVCGQSHFSNTQLSARKIYLNNITLKLKLIFINNINSYCRASPVLRSFRVSYIPIKKRKQTLSITKMTLQLHY